MIYAPEKFDMNEKGGEDEQSYFDNENFQLNSKSPPKMLF
jgi:hypothetical protein